MPNQVRIISQRNSAKWDDIIGDLMRGNTWRAEQTYGGITNQDRADRVRRCLRTAAKHKGIAAKVYWNECDQPGKCMFGDDCAFHVKYSIFPLEEARNYKSQQAQKSGKSPR